MQNTDTSHFTPSGARHSTMGSYVAGFLLSIAFTLIPYFLVVKHVPSSPLLGALVVGFALAQLIVQLVFFLHVGRESKPHWNTLALSFAVLMVVIVVVGSLWIMQNLNSNMMSDPSMIMDNSSLETQHGGF